MGIGQRELETFIVGLSPRDRLQAGRLNPPTSMSNFVGSLPSALRTPEMSELPQVGISEAAEAYTPVTTSWADLDAFARRAILTKGDVGATHRGVVRPTPPPAYTNFNQIYSRSITSATFSGPPEVPLDLPTRDLTILASSRMNRTAGGKSTDLRSATAVLG